MGWASRYIQKLRAGETVSFRPHGQSMTGRIESGQLCTVVPIDPTIGNNRGFINGWIGPEDIYGKCVKVEP
jgi:hypothetical protein